MASSRENNIEGAFSQEDCYFPPGKKANPLAQHSEIVSIWSQNLSLDGISHDQDLSSQSVHAAWALLLRAYLSKDVVSFAHITESHERKALIESSKRTCLDATGASLYQYTSLGERQCGDYGPDLVRPLGQHDIQSGRVNTAVTLGFQEFESQDKVEDGCLSYLYDGGRFEVGHSTVHRFGPSIRLSWCLQR